LDKLNPVTVILRNAHFIDFKKSPSEIKAILVNNGLIEKIYFKEKSLPRGVKKINLRGNYVIPGFIDCHAHLISRGIELRRIDLGKCKSLNDCFDELRAGLKKERNLIFGSNWDESSWPSGALDNLNRYTLDKISRNKPIIMRRVCGHCAVANTKALSLIPEKWQIIDRQKGYLYEDVALSLNDIFKPSNVMLEKAVRLGAQEALSNGITSVHEISDLKRFNLLQKLKRNHGLQIRLSLYILEKYFHNILAAGMTSDLGDDYLKFSGIKVFLDGSIGARTAALSKPYKNMQTRGKILLSKYKINKLVKIAEKNQIQLMIHSIGDRTTAAVLNVFQEVIDKKNPQRHRLEHLEILNRRSIHQLARLNIIASMQPNFVRRWQQPGGMYEQYLGKRYREMNCFKVLHAAGVKVVFGSDCMPFGPLFGLPGAFNHPLECGRINRSDAFKMYTQEGAYATFDEHKKGGIEIGKFADLVILDRNPLMEKNLDKIKVLTTIVGGNIVYKRHRLPKFE
jgi:predicted amidohydrolase YtcJ